ncbi:MAG: glycosyltransferase family 4 protein [Actinobacteria bacterium]|nr:glycosyltransferase family 4 protein [Actinomycetota bacterium]
MSPRVAVVTGDDLTDTLAGPGIRAWNMAEVLAGAGHEVVLATTGRADRAHSHAQVRSVADEGAARDLARGCDVLVFQGLLLDHHPSLADVDVPMVVDLYDPFHLEQLERTRRQPATRDQVVREVTAIVDEQLLRGDFFLCASERQRDFWIGHLAALGRVNAHTYDDDPSLDGLIAVAPFGVAADPPAPGPSVKGTIDGLGPDDRLVLWAGGVYDWLDPLTVVRAVDRVRAQRDEVRLLFLGMGHPSEGESAMARTLRGLAGELGLTGRHVLFNDRWVPYDERARWLLSADIGVSAHLRHVEAAYAFRTRILDYLWTGLPVVTTAGDTLSGLVVERGAGAAVPPGDDAAMAVELLRLLDDDGRRATSAAAARALAADLTWPRVLAPLVAFCARPRRAPDLADARLGAELAASRRDQSRVRRGWQRDIDVAVRRTLGRLRGR